MLLTVELKDDKFCDGCPYHIDATTCTGGYVRAEAVITGFTPLGIHPYRPEDCKRENG